MKDWTPDAARGMCAGLMASMGGRWDHVQAVGQFAEALGRRHGDQVPDAVIAAAWLHDVGYARSLADTGLHPLDGARYLSQRAAPRGIVSLVAFHSGAEFEAEERGLGSQLAQFDRPSQDDLDVLILADMTTSPTGQRVTVQERLAEILRRYDPADPVHRAVTRSSSYLLECAARASARLGLPDEWTAAPL